MPAWKALKVRELIVFLKKAGFQCPYSDGKHQYMLWRNSGFFRRREFRESRHGALEGWIILGLRLGREFSAIDGVGLNRVKIETLKCQKFSVNLKE